MWEISQHGLAGCDGGFVVPVFGVYFCGVISCCASHCGLEDFWCFYVVTQILLHLDESQVEVLGHVGLVMVLVALCYGAVVVI